MSLAPTMLSNQDDDIEATLDAAIPDAQKRQKVMDSLGRLLEKAVEKAIDASDQRWDTKFPDLLQRIDTKIEEAVNASESRTASRLQTMQAQIDALSMRTPSAAASTAASVRETHKVPGMTASGMKSVPRKVEAKGFVKEWSLTDQQALTHQEVAQWVTTLYSALALELKLLVDLEKTQGFMTRILYAKIEVRLKEGNTNDEAWQLKKGIDQLLASTLSLKREGYTIRCMVEPSPQKKPYLQQGGKFLGTMGELLKEVGKTTDVLLKEWGPPLRFFVRDSEGRPVPLATYTLEEGWSLQESVLQSLLPSCTGESLMARLR